MKNVKLFVLCLFVYNIMVAQNKGDKTIEKLFIKNGEDVRIEDYPYQADLGGCGGSILGPTWILTAEHCIGAAVSVGSTIEVGYTKRSDRSSGQTARVKNVYNFDCNGYCDLSLLELETPLDLSGHFAKEVRYASELVFDLGYISDGGDCYATGWGQLDPNTGQTPDNLQGAALKFDFVAADDQRLRVNETEGRLVCRGDSGGPLVVENKDGEKILVGAVSGGEGQPCSDYGFWGNVINAADWIEQTTGIPPYSEDLVSTSDAINTNTDKIMDIWPIPAKDVININTSSEKPLSNIHIFDMNGKEVLNIQEATKTIPVSALASGMYILSASDVSSGQIITVEK